MNEFINKLKLIINDSLNNNYKDNWDYEVLGKEPLNRKKSIFNKYWDKKRYKNEFDELASKYGEGLNRLYLILSDERSKEQLLNIFAYRILGYKKIKLANNNQKYWNNRDRIRNIEKDEINIESPLKGKKLYLYNLESLNYPIKLISYPPAIQHTFFENHYSYTNDIEIDVTEGDFVIDAGGAWGDTALLFALKTGSNGKVITFEFEQSNLKLFDYNINCNPSLKPIIDLHQNALWDKDSLKLSFDSMGPATKVVENALNTNSIESITIDKIVEKYGKIDFIKMDIEGAEPKALIGARSSILKFRPKLAISLYHSISDFVFVADFISALDFGYKCYLSHPTIFERETVLIATPK